MLFKLWKKKIKPIPKPGQPLALVENGDLNGPEVPVVDTHTILDAHAELITLIERAVGPVEYSRYYKETVQRYVAAVHLLPASEAHHHCELGGMIRHSLEVARITVMRARAINFPMRVEERHQVRLKRHWKIASFMSGLMHDTGKIVNDMQVVSPCGRHVWAPALMEPIPEWAKKAGVKSYIVNFRSDRKHNEHELHNSAFVYTIMPKPLISELTSIRQEVMNDLLKAVGGEEVNSLIGPLVKAADMQSVSEDMVASRNRTSPFRRETPLERSLTDALRQYATAIADQGIQGRGDLLLLTTASEPDRPRLYGDMVKIAESVRHFARTHKVQGVPVDPWLLFDTLENAGLVRSTENGEEETVINPVTGEQRRMIQFTDAHWVLGQKHYLTWPRHDDVRASNEHPVVDNPPVKAIDDATLLPAANETPDKDLNGKKDAITTPTETREGILPPQSKPETMASGSKAIETTQTDERTNNKGIYAGTDIGMDDLSMFDQNNRPSQSEEKVPESKDKQLQGEAGKSGADIKIETKVMGEEVTQTINSRRPPPPVAKPIPENTNDQESGKPIQSSTLAPKSEEDAKADIENQARAEDWFNEALTGLIDGSIPLGERIVRTIEGEFEIRPESKQMRQGLSVAGIISFGTDRATVKTKRKIREAIKSAEEVRTSETRDFREGKVIQVPQSVHDKLHTEQPKAPIKPARQPSIRQTERKNRNRGKRNNVMDSDREGVIPTATRERHSASAPIQSGEVSQRPTARQLAEKTLQHLLDKTGLDLVGPINETDTRILSGRRMLKNLEEKHGYDGQEMLHELKAVAEQQGMDLRPHHHGVALKKTIKAGEADGGS